MAARDSFKSKLKTGEKKGEEKKGENKKVILILFLLTVILSIFFYIKGNFSDWLEGLFGPSEWKISK